MEFYLRKRGHNLWFTRDLTHPVDKLPDGAKEIGEVVFDTAEDLISISYYPQYAYLMIQRRPVESTNIKSVGYSQAGRIMVVEFTNGSVYQYGDVPDAVYGDFLCAPSKGKFFNAEIKNKYSSVKVEG